MNTWIKYNENIINISQCTAIRKRSAKEQNEEYILFNTTGTDVWWPFKSTSERDAVFEHINETFVCPIDMTIAIKDKCATINSFEEI